MLTPLESILLATVSGLLALLVASMRNKVDKQKVDVDRDATEARKDTLVVDMAADYKKLLEVVHTLQLEAKDREIARLNDKAETAADKATIRELNQNIVDLKKEIAELRGELSKKLDTVNNQVEESNKQLSQIIHRQDVAAQPDDTRAADEALAMNQARDAAVAPAIDGPSPLMPGDMVVLAPAPIVEGPTL